MEYVVVDEKNLIERKAAAADEAVLFMRELLGSVETLRSIAEVHGTRTLVDLMYLQGAILDGGFIDHYPDESAVMEIVGSLPSAERWKKFVKQEYMAQREAFAYQVTEEDVHNVLSSNALAVANTNGKSFESIACEVFPDLDFDLIEQAALYGDDIDEQTDYANDEIARQLRAMGIIEPLQDDCDRSDARMMG